jgi:hypothetical protein
MGDFIVLLCQHRRQETKGNYILYIWDTSNKKDNKIATAMVVVVAVLMTRIIMRIHGRKILRRRRRR